ncbi:MAG: hypothetical protein SGBAC_000670 [Bacillariaceae sp.]
MSNTDPKPALDRLIEIFDDPLNSILPLLHDGKDKKIGRLDLINIIKELFQTTESLAKQYQEISKKNDKDTPSGLSGLSEIIGGDEIDSETLWGQVELQNKALNKLVKKSKKKLEKAPEKICVLDMKEILSESEEDENDGSEEDKSEKSHDDDDEEGSVDSETRRIRERMDRAMEDESDDGEGNEEEVDEIREEKKVSEDEESLVDPVADQMKDGFFNLNEMEDFADEEEDFLPEEAFGQPKQEDKKKSAKSFHQRQRDGDLENAADSEDDDFDDMYEDVQSTKRKKYRDEKEIDALYTLYQDPQNDDSDESEDEDDAANMTAADLFGKPKMHYYQKYYKGKKSKEAPAKMKGDDDDDSWGDYNFQKEDQKGWRNDDTEEKDHEKEADSMGDDDAEPLTKGELKDGKKPVDNSAHGRRIEKLRRQTEELEKEMIAEKPWQMTGETTSKTRPVNSLLEGTPEFEMASKQAPTITVEQTASLEEIIKQRILAEDWDDVVPRELPDVAWNKKRGELPEVSQEKSKLGLGELYEREYLKKAVGYDVDAEEKKSEEDKAKDEMKQLFANLCSKLDALSNYHFAPRPVSDEAEVRAVTAPAIAMEEVLPLHVSDARGVAPEEVYASKRGREGIVRDESEMDQQDRKRLRSSKKAKRRKARKEKLADEKLISRLEPGLGLNNPYEKRKMREELALARSRGKVTTGEQEVETKYGSSGTFFKRLQNEAHEAIQGTSTQAEKRPKVAKSKSSVYKL